MFRAPLFLVESSGADGGLFYLEDRMAAEPGTESLLPTRQSLLSRLKDCEDQDGWREFFDTYWRLIYKVARQAGLDESKAQDVVQMTFIYLTRRMPKFRYDPARGSFKAWLLRVTRSRISVLRRAADDREVALPDRGLENDDANIWEAIPDPAADVLEPPRSSGLRSR